MTSRPGWVHLALAAAVSTWAVNQIVTKSLLGSVPPLLFLFVRFLGLLTLGGLLAWRARGQTPWTGKERLLAGLAGAGFALNQLTFVFGIDQTTAFSTALLIATSPIWALSALALVRIERVGQRQWFGVLAAFGGLALFLSDGARLGLGKGDLLSLMAGMTFAAFNVLNRPLLQRHRPDEVLAANLLVGGVPLLLIAAPSGFHAAWAGIPGPAWLAIAYTVLFPVFVANLVWNWGVRRVGLGRTVVYANLNPILAGALSGLLLHETFDAAKVAGALGCLAGLILAAGGAHQPRPGSGTGN